MVLAMSSRRAQKREAALEEIKAAARAQMAELGAGAVSLRGIARALGLTAPALYRYYPSYEALLTDLILEGFHHLADSIQAAQLASQAAGHSPTEQIMAMTAAYRDWAVTHPQDFLLIYGTPLPNYQAPVEQTMPAARRTGELFAAALEAAIAAGEVQIPPTYLNIPPQYAEQLPTPVHYMVYCAWGMIHGLLMLEVTGHLSFLGDAGEFYQAQMSQFYRGLGLANSK
jgi:AcrR family transcriptional regulator